MKNKVLCILLSLVCIFSLSGCTGGNYKQFQVKFNNQAGSAENEWAAYDGEWIYLPRVVVENGTTLNKYIVKMSTSDLSKKEVIPIDSSPWGGWGVFPLESLQCIDEYLFFEKRTDYDCGIYYIAPRQTESKLSLNYEFIRQSLAHDETGYDETNLFFCDENNAICSINKKLILKKELTEASYQKEKKVIYKIPQESYVEKIVPIKNYLFVVIITADEFSMPVYSVWRMNKNGENPIQFNDICNVNAFYDDQIYFLRKDESGEYYKLNSANLDGTNFEEIPGVEINKYNPIFNVSEEFIFYRGREDKIIRVDKNGENPTVLLYEKTKYIQIFEDWLFYEDDLSSKWYRMHFDGSDHELVLDVWE